MVFSIATGIKHHSSTLNSEKCFMCRTAQNTTVVTLFPRLAMFTAYKAVIGKAPGCMCCPELPDNLVSYCIYVCLD